MKNIGYEYKQLVTPEIYNILMLKLNNITTYKEITQINYYYDDEYFSLFDKDETLRVRQKQDKLVLERKYNKQYSVDGEKISEESCSIIEKFPMKLTIENRDYHYIGNLVTLRKNYTIGNNIISLDTSYYLGKADYELEIESDKEVILPEFVTEIIDFRNHNDGKYKHFIKRLKELNS